MRQLVYLLVVLVLLGSWAGVKKYRLENRERQEQKLAVAVETVLPQFSATSVRMLRLMKGQTGTTFELARKEGEDWWIQAPSRSKAHKRKVGEILKKLSELKGEARSEAPDLLGEFDLTDSKAVRIEWFDAQEAPLGSLWVSPKRSGDGKNFVRLPDSTRVLAVSPDILMELGLEKADSELKSAVFEDLRLMALDLSKVRRIELGDRKGTYVLSRPQSQNGQTQPWSMEPAAKTEIDGAKVNKLLSAVSNWHGKRSLAPDSPEAGAVSAAAWIKLSVERDDKTVDAVFYRSKTDAGKKAAILRVEPDQIFYEMDASALDAVQTDREGFLKH